MLIHLFYKFHNSYPYSGKKYACNVLYCLDGVTLDLCNALMWCWGHRLGHRSGQECCMPSALYSQEWKSAESTMAVQPQWRCRGRKLLALCEVGYDYSSFGCVHRSHSNLMISSYQVSFGEDMCMFLLGGPRNLECEVMRARMGINWVSGIVYRYL